MSETSRTEYLFWIRFFLVSENRIELAADSMPLWALATKFGMPSFGGSVMSACSFTACFGCYPAYQGFVQVQCIDLPVSAFMLHHSL